MPKKIDYYDQINKALKSYEEYKSWHEKSIDWICNRIDWCYKWGKITSDQTRELTDRICEVMNHVV